MASASTLPTSASNENKKIVWFWQSNPNPWDEKEKQEWKRYSDFENDFIEKAFQRKEKEVQLNDYVVDFKYSVQFNKDDRCRQRTVKREVVDLSELVREERFAYPQRAVKSYDNQYKNDYDFRWQWLIANKQIAGNNKAIAELAAQGKSVRSTPKLLDISLCRLFVGILKEGKRLNQDFDAERMAEQLRSCRSDEEILACVPRLYSAESFLYKLLNTTLRNKDMSKLDTLGPFCVLLWLHLRNNNDKRDQLLYRGMTLTDEMVEEYKQAVGHKIVWHSFTSTSKDHRIAEQFGNTLFIILLKDLSKWLSDISSLSHYPHEQEILLQNHCVFTIDKIERDPENGKYSIYMHTE
jgi:hypothetical protein